MSSTVLKPPSASQTCWHAHKHTFNLRHPWKYTHLCLNTHRQESDMWIPFRCTYHKIFGLLCVSACGVTCVITNVLLICTPKTSMFQWWQVKNVYKSIKLLNEPMDLKSRLHAYKTSVTSVQICSVVLMLLSKEIVLPCFEAILDSRLQNLFQISLR